MSACMYCPVRLETARRKVKLANVQLATTARGLCHCCNEIINAAIRRGELTRAEAVANSWCVDVAACRQRA